MKSHAPSEIQKWIQRESFELLGFTWMSDGKQNDYDLLLGYQGYVVLLEMRFLSATVKLKHAGKELSNIVLDMSGTPLDQVLRLDEAIRRAGSMRGWDDMGRAVGAKRITLISTLNTRDTCQAMVHEIDAVLQRYGVRAGNALRIVKARV